MKCAWQTGGPIRIKVSDTLSADWSASQPHSLCFGCCGCCNREEVNDVNTGNHFQFDSDVEQIVLMEPNKNVIHLIAGGWVIIIQRIREN